MLCFVHAARFVHIVSSTREVPLVRRVALLKALEDEQADEAAQMSVEEALEQRELRAREENEALLCQKMQVSPWP